MQEFITSPIRQNLSQKLKDRDYRHSFFRIRGQGEVASRIRELRELRKRTQIELATLCKMKQSAISRAEQASYSSWNIKTLWRLAEALDVRMRITFEPMEDVIRQYEELEREEYVHLAISAAFEGQREQAVPLEMTQETNERAIRQAQFTDETHDPDVKQYLVGQPILSEAIVREAR